MSENNTESAQVEIMPASAIEAITRGEIDVQIATAHKYPRSLDVYKKRAIAMATIDVETAESCLYARPVGGGKIAEGMSVRMAEIVGACYGNLRVGAIILEMSETQVKARGVAHDLETNFASSSDIIESCLKSDGKTPYDARMRVTVAKAAVAKARRDATFQVVPKALARPIERAVRALLADEKIQTFGERRDAVVKWITEKLKIDPSRVWALLEIKGQDDLQQEHLDLLAGLKTAIKDGETTIDEAFPQPMAKAPMFEKKAKPGTTIPPKTSNGAAQDSAAKPESDVSGASPATPTAARQTDVKPSDPVSSPDSAEASLAAMMAQHKMTADELKSALKMLHQQVPSRFEGPQDLRDDALAFAHQNWAEIVKFMEHERGDDLP